MFGSHAIGTLERKCCKKKLQGWCKEGHNKQHSPYNSYIKSMDVECSIAVKQQHSRKVLRKEVPYDRRIATGVDCMAFE